MPVGSTSAENWLPFNPLDVRIVDWPNLTVPDAALIWALPASAAVPVTLANDAAVVFICTR